QMTLSDPPPVQYYVPQHQFAYSGMTIVIRSSTPPASLTPKVRQELSRLDSELPLFNARPYDQVLANATARPWFQTILFVAFAGLALTLALVGVYGVLSYTVSQRLHEIGIRMCLGAQRRDVIWLLLRQAMRPVLTGLAIGILLALGTARLMATLLFG